MVEYAFWKAPTNGSPEFTSGGHGVSIIPGLGRWILLHGAIRSMPHDAIPVSKVVALFDAFADLERLLALLARAEALLGCNDDAANDAMTLATEICAALDGTGSSTRLT